MCVGHICVCMFSCMYAYVLKCVRALACVHACAYVCIDVSEILE